jgi:2-polyprenyl-3-methyl-5-hydroxy-6-metoxy-1,4-benzoquinol methylase
MDIKTLCPICETFDNTSVVYKSNFSKATFNEEIFSARRLPDRQHYQWVRCSSCSLLRSDPIWDQNLKDLYTGSTFDYGGEIEGLKRTYLKLLTNVCGNRIPKSVLEIGGGNGFFLEAVRTLGDIKILGIEPSEDAIKKAHLDIKPFLIQDVMGPQIVPHNSFEVCAMFHTLDHLPDPIAVLKSCIESISPGGVLIVAVHNEKAFSAKILGEKSPIFDVEHTHLYSKETAELLFQKLDLDQIKVSSYRNLYSLAYILHLMPISRKLRASILSSSFGKLLSKIRVNLPLGNIVISGVKRG